MSLGYLWLDLRILFASNSLKLCFKLFFFTEKKNAFLKINFYIKISKNLGGNFSNLGSNCLDIWPFFRNFLAFQKASFQHFTSTIGAALSCQQWFLQAGRCATKEEKPLLATVCFPSSMRVHVTSLSLVLQEKSAKQQLCTFFSIFCSFLSVFTRLRRKKMAYFAFFMEKLN